MVNLSKNICHTTFTKILTMMKNPTGHPTATRSTATYLVVVADITHTMKDQNLRKFRLMMGIQRAYGSVMQER